MSLLHQVLEGKFNPTADSFATDIRTTSVEPSTNSMISKKVNAAYGIRSERLHGHGSDHQIAMTIRFRLLQKPPWPGRQDRNFKTNNRNAPLNSAATRRLPMQSTKQTCGRTVRPFKKLPGRTIRSTATAMPQLQDRHSVT